MGEAVNKVETHTPKIEVPSIIEKDKPFTISIFVGPHPNTLEHSIRYIEVYFYEEGRKFNPISLARVHLTPTYVEPDIKLTLKLKKSGILYVVEYCNLHGLWEAREHIKVK